MKYCTECGSEYQDSVTACADDGNTELVSAAEMRSRNLPMVESKDDRRFVRAGVAEDPLSSERFAATLEAEGIAVQVRARRGGTIDSITTGGIAPWSELWVAEEDLARASALLASLRQELEPGADEAARAAEEEAGQS